MKKNTTTEKRALSFYTYSMPRISLIWNKAPHALQPYPHFKSAIEAKAFLQGFVKSFGDSVNNYSFSCPAGKFNFSDFS